ncbi:hypothetical protein SF12_20390 [Streptomyces sp. MBRL 601]|nr:hypothetical protein SF12_20390 [Streptomyces sp. MBRL 601]
MPFSQMITGARVAGGRSARGFQPQTPPARVAGDGDGGEWAGVDVPVGGRGCLEGVDQQGADDGGFCDGDQGAAVLERAGVEPAADPGDEVEQALPAVRCRARVPEPGIDARGSCAATSPRVSPRQLPMSQSLRAGWTSGAKPRASPVARLRWVGEQ